MFTTKKKIVTTTIYWFVLRASDLHNAKANMKVLHPLPRVDEIATDVDKTPHAWYFQQAGNGIFARQDEVFQFRMLHEYHSEVIMTPIGSRTARWINPDQLDEKMSSSRNLLVQDIHGDPLFLFENQYAERWFADKYPDVKLTAKM